MSGFEQTYVVDSMDYLNSLIEICLKENVGVIVPGGEQPLQILNSARMILSNLGIALAANSKEVTDIFTNKGRTFEVLREKGFAVPMTIEPQSEADFSGMRYPCVIKPSTGSGGSDGVMIARSSVEAVRYWRTTTEEGRMLLLQEYVPHHDGEFSIGVLSVPGHGVVGSIALKKSLKVK